MTRIVTAAAMIFAAAASPVAASDQVPGSLPEGPVAIVGATVHTASGDVFREATVVIDAARIVAVGPDVAVPEGAETVDGSGKHVYPGLFDAFTELGLHEISSVRASDDARESGSLNPNVRSDKAINPDSEVIPVTRTNGVLLALTAPAGGIVAGQAAVIQLDGWTTEDMTVRPRAAMIVSLRSDDSVQRLTDFLDDAEAYLAAVDAGENPPHDLKLEAMRDVLAGKQPVIVRADRWTSIERAAAMAGARGVRLVLLGGADAERVAPLLKKYDVPVIISATHRKPISRDARYDAAYTLPARLKAAGVRFCISGYDRAETWNTRNLAYHAATAAAFGLSPEDALRSITLSPAEILGVADRVGSIAEGRDATLILADGDILETTTNVLQAWVAGRPVDLDNKQTELYRKYQAKYGDVEPAADSE